MTTHRDSIGFLFGDIARLSRQAFNHRARSLGLSLAQWRVLAVLSRQQGINQVKLAEMLEIQPMTLVRQIDRLETLGLVTRRQDPDDRRASRLVLTEAAQPLIGHMRRIADELWNEVFAEFSADEREALVAVLQRVKAGLCPHALSANESDAARAGSGS
jgi:DNA-binding MarR family transcriptional regulator